MKSAIRTIGMTLALSFVGAATALAADATMGTWKLNDAKSKFAQGAAKNTTVMYEAAGDAVKVTIDGLDSKGAATHTEWTGKFDGQDYAVTGDPNSDMRSYTRVNGNLMDFTVKNAGKVDITGRIVVTADGMHRTVTSHSTDAKGKKSTSTAVFDKQ